MNEPVIALVGVVFAALISLAGVIYVQRSTKSIRESETMTKHDAETKRLESEAYSRARESYEAAIARYHGDLARMQGHIESLEQRVALTERRAREAEARAATAERLLHRLKIEFEERNLPLPPEVADLPAEGEN